MYTLKQCYRHSLSVTVFLLLDADESLLDFCKATAENLGKITEFNEFAPVKLTELDNNENYNN